MVFLVRSRKVHCKQWIKFLQRFLSSVASHFLRLIHNYNWPVGLNDINRLSAAKFIQFHTDTASILAASIERLHINDHNRQIGTGTEIINIRQILRIVDKKASLLSVVFHKMILHSFKALVDTFTNSNRRNDHNKLTPTIQFVEFEHRLDIYICLSGSGFHLRSEERRVGK